MAEIKKLIFYNNEMLKLLKKIKTRIEESEEWWMDCPDKGGFDLEEIEKVIASVEDKSCSK